MKKKNGETGRKRQKTIHTHTHTPQQQQLNVPEWENREYIEKKIKYIAHMPSTYDYELEIREGPVSVQQNQ